MLHLISFKQLFHFSCCFSPTTTIPTSTKHFLTYTQHDDDDDDDFQLIVSLMTDECCCLNVKSGRKNSRISTFEKVNEAENWHII